MSIHFRVVSPAVAAALAISAGGPLTAQIVVRPAPLAVTADSLTKGAEAQIVNSGVTPVLLTSWTLDTFTSRSGKRIPGRTENIAGGMRVPARSRVVLVIDMDTASWNPALAGTYQSYLTVAYANGSAEAQIFVTKPEPAANVGPPADTTAARALVQELTVDARNGWPGEFRDRIYVPAWQGTEMNAATLVLNSAGTVPALARVDTPRVWQNHPPLREYPIKLRHLRGGHTYTGRIHLGGDTTTTGVTLTVHASHHVGFFLLTVLAGVITGLLVRRWTDLGRPINLMRERVLRAALLYRDALAGHAATGWPRDALEKEFLLRQEATDARLRSLSPYLVKDEEVEKEFASVRAEVEVLEAKPRQLTALTAELKTLHGVAEKLTAAARRIGRPPEGRDYLPEIPTALEAAATTLQAPLVTLDSLESARTDAAAQRAFLGTWADMLQDTGTLKDWWDRLGHPRDEKEAELLKVADQRLGEVRWRLWEVPDAASLDTASLTSALGEAKMALRQVAILRQVTAESALADGSREWMEEASPTGREPLLTELDKSRTLPVSPAAQLRLLDRLRARRLSRDVGLGLAAFIVSLLATLAKDYHNDPFGTFQDYSSVLAWSFGLTASVTLLASGLASLQTTGLRALFRR